MRKLLFLLLFLPVVCFAGRVCKFISTDGTEVTYKKVTREEIAHVLIYLEESEVPKDAKRIGMILNGAKTQEDAITQSRKLAARVGGKAIFLHSGKELTGGQKMANTWAFGRYRAKWVFYVYG